jgi:hypothetical protein
MPKSNEGNDENSSAGPPAVRPAKPRRSAATRGTSRAATPASGGEPVNSLQATAEDSGAFDPVSQSISMGSEPSEEDIRMRAYHRYLERGAGHGLDFEDWLEAERELKRR